jgi:protein SCO1
LIFRFKLKQFNTFKSEGVALQKIIMKKRLLWYVLFFAALIAVFWYAVFKDQDLTKSPLAIINYNIDSFSFTNQNGKKITEKDIEGKVYVAEYFFTTCQGICPKMNANMRRVYDEYKTEENFLILSHTCMPEVDSVLILKKYEQKMLNGILNKTDDGAYNLKYDTSLAKPVNATTNWNFLTGNKAKLYEMARQSYMIDNNKPDSTQLIKDQFIHTQFFALIDKYRRLRGIYDGLKEDEIQKLLHDIKGLLKEKMTTKRFMNGFDNNPS